MNQRISLDTIYLEQIGQTDERNTRCMYVALTFEPTNVALVVLRTARLEYAKDRLHYFRRLIRRGVPFFLKYSCLLSSLELPVRITALLDFSGRVSQYESGNECMMPVKQSNHTSSSAM